MMSGNLKNKNGGFSLFRKSENSILGIFGLVILSFLMFLNLVFAQEIPYSQGKVYVCPLADSMEKVNPKCECRIDLNLDETTTSTCNGKNYEMTLQITEYEGKEYYTILGFENGGAGVNLEPVAKISAPSEGYVGQEILFDGSQSFDPNDDPLNFSWNFGDGQSAQGVKVSNIFSKEGSYSVILTVSDGMVSSSTKKEISIKKGVSAGIPVFSKFEIKKETIKVSEITKNSAKITWQTNYLSTSQVVFSAENESRNFNLDLPNFGYSHSKEGDDSKLEKVTLHSVTLLNLNPGTKYYYRTVSRGSFEISDEFSFSTLKEEVKEEIKKEETPISKIEKGISRILKKKEAQKEAPVKKELEKITKKEIKPERKIFQKEIPQLSLLLASLKEIKNNPPILVLLAISLFGIFTILIRKIKFCQKKKK
jgi:PKD repeat protein